MPIWAFNRTVKKPELWAEFHEAVHKSKYTCHVLCKHCDKSYAHPSTVGKTTDSGTTKSMSRHLQSCQRYKDKKGNRERMSAFESRLESGQTTLADYDNDTMVDKTLKFFISGNIAFNQADNPYFQDLIRHGEAKQKGIKVNRKSVRARLSEVGANATEDLMATLMANDSKVSLALDCWTSKNGHAFLGNTPVSYISAPHTLNFSFCMLQA
jgi:hypothetical protein